MPRIKKEWIQATPENVKKGMKCRVKQSLVKSYKNFVPAFDWGKVHHSEEGVVANTSFGVDNLRGHCIKVDFPSHSYWTALTSEMEVFGKGEALVCPESEKSVESYGFRLLLKMLRLV